MSDPSQDDPREVTRVLRQQVESLGHIVDEQERTIELLRRELLHYSSALGWRLQLRLDGFRTAMLRIPVLRQVYRTLYRALEIWVDEGFVMIFVRAGDKIGLALRGRDCGVEDHDRGPRSTEERYQVWIGQHPSPDAETMRASIARFTTAPLISVLAVIDGTDASGVQALVATLEAQSYERWEACVAISTGERAQLGGAFEQICASEPRVRVAEVAGTATWADAFQLAGGDYLAFLEPGDELAPEALYALVGRLQSDPGLDVVYSDEDAIGSDGRRGDPLFKPDWSPDLLLSTNYLQRFGIFRRQLAIEVGAFQASAGLGQPYDLALRLSERARGIAHVPKVLYHNLRRPTTVDAVLARHAANRDESRVIVDALNRRGTPGRTSPVFARIGSRCYATRLDLRQQPLVSIIIPTRDKKALLQTTIESIWKRTDYPNYEIIVVDNESTDPEAVQYLASLQPRCQVHTWRQPFNYSALNNFGVRHARGEQLLFLNNDMEVIRPDWLTAMLEHAQRPEVGAVGARLLYGDGRIQHAGVVVGINRVAANAFRSWPGETIGNPRLADLTRNCSAVTGACLMVPRRIFDEVGGFDEAMRVVLNDVDLCLKIRERGYLVVYTPHALLYHYEGSSRGRLHPPPDEKAFNDRWNGFLDAGDPYYNPNLSKRHDDWSLDVEIK